MLAFLSPLSADYPGFDGWYKERVVSGVRNGSRRLVVVEHDGRIAGVGIGKDTPDERKLCTVRVAPEFEGRGIGIRLIDGLLDWMGEDQPHLTIANGRLHKFERLIDHFGFELTSTKPEIYRSGSSEHFFNESRL